MSNPSTIWHPYCGVAPTPAELFGRWNLDPVLLGALGLVALLYVVRFRDAAPRRAASFATGFGLLLIVFVSPFCALCSALFSARVMHHVVTTAIVAPLLVWSVPRGALRVPGGLAPWTGAAALIFWLWHSPPLYAWALSSDAAYWLMQTTLLGSAIGFWAALRRAPVPAAIAALLATMVQMGLLGALITFSGAALYAPHFATTQAWGLTPLEDQQLAGLVMWVPAAGLYLGAALVLLGRWLGPDKRLVPAS